MYLELNREAATKILTHPSVYPIVGDDNSMRAEDFSIPEMFKPLVCIALGGQPAACTIYHWRNCVTAEVHVSVLPEWRSASYLAGRDMLTWLWTETPAEKLVGMIPTDNRQALLYTLRLGFKIEGICSKSFLRNGQLLDQTMIGLERK